MTLSHWIHRSIDRPRHAADVVIIGAGISGISLAWWLRDSGLRVVLLERDVPCAGATGRNAGFATVGSVAHFARQIEEFDLSTALQLRAWLTESLEGLTSTLAYLDVACEHRPCHGFSVARTRAALDRMTHAAELLREAGEPDVTDVDTATIAEATGLHGFLGGVRIRGEGQLDPIMAMTGLLGDTEARLLTHQHVLHIEPTATGHAVITRDRRFEADKVVFAAGGFGALLHPSITPRIVPRLGQALVTTPTAPFLSDLVYAVEDWVYLRQLLDGRILIGGRRILDPEGEVGTEDRLNPRIQEALDDFRRTHMPAHTHLTVERRWSGPLAYTADGLPLVGELGDKGLYMLGGYSGHGMAWGFIAARWLAALLTRGVAVPALLDAGRRLETPATP